MNLHPGRPPSSLALARPRARFAAAAVLAVLASIGLAPVADASIALAPVPAVSVEPGGFMLLAAGKDFRPPPRKPPRRGSSAELNGGSSAERYGGSSADRSGVAGQRDVRNRSVHARRQKPPQNEDGGANERREQEAQDERESQQAGERQVLEFDFGSRRQRR